MFKNAKTVHCYENYTFFLNASPLTVLTLEKKLIMIFVENLRKILYIDICTSHKKSCKNVDLNICAQKGHSVSVLGHKHGFEQNPTVIKERRNGFRESITIWRESSVKRTRSIEIGGRSIAVGGKRLAI